MNHERAGLHRRAAPLSGRLRRRRAGAPRVAGPEAAGRRGRRQLARCTVGPDKDHLAAMARFEAAGKKLSPEEKAKRDEHPFDAYARFKSESAKGQFPKGVDNFRWRFHGLFYVAPTQNSYMCRLRIPNGILSHWQFAGVADLAERYGGGYAHVTTRANLQIREVMPESAVALIEGLTSLGITTKGTGADNIRNVTGSPTAGIDPQELLDTRPHASAWHHHILNDRSLYGLPRKFNVGFDGGGAIPVLEDTNDIAFTAVTVAEGAGVDAGVWYRLGIGGITGHEDFAKYGNVYVKPRRGDRGGRRHRARVHRPRRPHRPQEGAAQVRARCLGPRQVPRRGRRQAWATAGAPAGRQGVSTQPPAPPGARRHPCRRSTAGQGVGRRRAARRQAHVRADARPCQNRARAGRRRYPPHRLAEPADLRRLRRRTPALVERCLAEIGLTSKATSIRAGLIACTGNIGCKFALSNTKGTAMAIAEWVEPRVALDTPINIHLTGCPHSCAQHYIGDIGMLACRVPIDEAGEDTVEGFHVYVGGGFGPDAGIARELYRDVKAEDCPRLVERILRAYLAAPQRRSETFLAFARRHDIATLKAMVDAMTRGRRMTVQPP